MESALRAGAVSYLNTKPLIAHLPRLAPGLELILEVPSRLAIDLDAGLLDVALIPSIEYFRAGRYSIIHDVSISSFGPVLSVKLCSRKPFETIETVAVDAGSRTSIALMQILLQQLFNVAPQSRPLPLYQDATTPPVDAVLVIGDRAMRIPDGAFPFTLDLGYEWSRWTGLPFVWAFWSVAENVHVSPAIQEAFVEAKVLGRPEIPQIAAQEASRLGLDVAQCQYYLQHVIRHDFGEDELAGLLRFQELAVAAGLAPEGVSCVFHDSQRLIESR